MCVCVCVTSLLKDKVAVIIISSEIPRLNIYLDELTVVCVDEMCRLRGVVDELDLADLPHLGALVTNLLQRAERRTQA